MVRKSSNCFVLYGLAGSFPGRAPAAYLEGFNHSSDLQICFVADSLLFGPHYSTLSAHRGTF